MSALDLVIYAAAAVGFVIGYVRGFVSQLVSAAGVFVAFFIASRYYEAAAPWVEILFPLSAAEPAAQYEQTVRGLGLDRYLYNAAAFALLFFCAKIGLSIAGYLLKFIARAPGINLANRWSGAVLACAEVLLIAVISVNVMNVMPSERTREWVAKSAAARFLLEHTPTVAGKLHELWNRGESGGTSG